MTYVSQAPILYLMIACHMPSIHSRTVCNGGMANAMQAPELHAMRAWHMCPKLRNCI
jgi:hypothetical protein